MKNNKLVHQLNGLIELNTDASRGFQMAADHVKSSALQNLFTECAQQRSIFATELQNRVRLLGGEPDQAGCSLGTAHRAWMGVKATFSGHEDEAMIEACITGEKRVVHAYEALLKGPDIPLSLRIFLSGQCDVISGTLDSIKELEEIVE